MTDQRASLGDHNASMDHISATCSDDVHQTVAECQPVSLAAIGVMPNVPVSSTASQPASHAKPAAEHS